MQYLRVISRAPVRRHEGDGKSYDLGFLVLCLGHQAQAGFSGVQALSPKPLSKCFKFPC